MTTAPYFGGEPVPDVAKLVKHSVWGWRHGDGEIQPDAPRNGHTFDSVRRKGTFFPRSWSDQEIAEAITTTIESPDFVKARAVRRVVYRDINDVMVTVEWDYVKGTAKGNTAYPTFENGVARFVPSKNERVEWSQDHEKTMRKARRVIQE